MKLLTHFELASKTTTELHGLYREAFNAIANSTPDSIESRNAHISLNNIKTELGLR